jgi:hypothetical protein
MTDLKQESMGDLVRLIANHPALTSVSLANNPHLGFQAAKQVI